MKNFVLIMMLCFWGVSCTSQLNTVHLKGELKNFPSELMMSNSSPKGKLLKKGVKITLDDQNRFDITIELEESTYYRLGRNTLYLSPGDEMELFCDLDNPNAGSFKGDGAEACDYLKSKPFPKGGSYITENNLLKNKPSKEEVRKLIAKKVMEKQAELNALKDVSEKFRKIESARILFDAANSLMSYGFYAAYTYGISQDEMKKFSEESNAFFEVDINKYCAQGGDADYLSIDTYLSVMERCIQLKGKEKVDQEILDFGIAYPLIMQLGYNGPIASVLTTKEKSVKEIKTLDYIDAINKAFKKYDLIMPGKLADDLNMKNMAGETVNLSDFRGKVVVIDVWATWCGPCKAESPYFEKLAEKYKENTNFKFVSISIDSNVKTWEKYLAKHEKVSEQLICNRTEFEKFVLQGVPRFMVIDKEGKVVDAFAPRPSDSAFEKLLKKNI